LGISKKWHSLTPPPTFVGNQNMGNKMKKKKLTKYMNGQLGDGRMQI
jgi:hypothetical protein